MSLKNIAIIVPCYNEEEALPIFIEEASKILVDTDERHYNYYFVNDGSSDRTLELLKEYASKNDNISYISLDRNHGQQSALLAGFRTASDDNDYFVSLDVDLQDPIECILEMADALDDGYDIAYGKRVDRSKDSFFKKTTGTMFYKTMNKLEGKEIFIQNTNTYRMITKRIRDIIINEARPDFSLLSSFNSLGFKQKEIPFKRNERSAGVTKYSVNKLFNYALSLIGSNTTKPILFPFKFSIGFLFISLLTFLTFMICYIIAYCDFTDPFLPIGNNFTPHYMLYAIFAILGFIGSVGSFISCYLSLQNIYTINILNNVRERSLYHIGEVDLKDINRVVTKKEKVKKEVVVEEAKEDKIASDKE